MKREGEASGGLQGADGGQSQQVEEEPEWGLQEEEGLGARGRGWGQGEGLGRGGGAVDGVSGSLGLAWLLSFVSNSERLSLLPNYRFS